MSIKIAKMNTDKLRIHTYADVKNRIENICLPGRTKPKTEWNPMKYILVMCKNYKNWKAKQ